MTPSIAPGRRATAVLLVLAPLLELGETVLSPLHDSSTRVELGHIATHQDRFAVSVLFGLTSLVLLVPMSIGLAGACVERTPRLARTAGWIVASAMIGFGCVRGTQAVQLASAKGGFDPATTARLLDAIGSNPLGIAMFVLFLGGTLVGLTLLGVATWRAGLPKVGSVLFIAFQLVDLATPGHLGTVAAHLVLLAATTTFAVALWNRAHGDERVGEPALAARAG